MKTWKEVVGDRRRRYIDMLRKAEELTLAQSAIDELHMVLENCIPVVRCKDCEYWAGAEDYDCEIHSGAFGADDFCSYGERRKDSEA